MIYQTKEKNCLVTLNFNEDSLNYASFDHLKDKSFVIFAVHQNNDISIFENNKQLNLIESEQHEVHDILAIRQINIENKNNLITYGCLNGSIYIYSYEGMYFKLNKLKKLSL